MKRHLFVILLLLGGTISFAQNRTETRFIEFEGLGRSYEVFVPSSYSTAIVYPLIFILHGGGGNGKAMVRHTNARFNKLAKQNNFITVYPSGYGKSWNDGGRDTLGIARKMELNDVGFFLKMIEELETKYSIDSKNIFVCGISNGGFMSQRLAFELSDKIKGIGVVAANLSRTLSQQPFPENQVPVLFINGTTDPIVPYDGGYVTAFKQKRGKVLSVKKSIETWKLINSASQKLEVIKISNKNKKDNCAATKTVWYNPEKPEIKVVEIKIINGGHSWPGAKQYLPKRWIGNTNRDFNGCDEIWNFFKSLMVE